MSPVSGGGLILLDTRWFYGLSKFSHDPLGGILDTFIKNE